MQPWVGYIIIAILIAVIIWLALKPTASSSSSYSSSCSSSSDTDLLKSMYKLWAEHVVWTRLFIMASFNDAPNLKLVTNRLLKNQIDLGNSIVPYYGGTAGSKLTSLLREQVMLQMDIVESLKVKDDDMKDRSVSLWYKNADALSDFLGSLNPYFSKQMLRDMLNDHMKLTTQEIMAQYNRDWQEDIASFDEIFDQVLMMADNLTAGINKQFR